MITQCEQECKHGQCDRRATMYLSRLAFFRDKPAERVGRQLCDYHAGKEHAIWLKRPQYEVQHVAL